jgi:hypothetical protein
MEIDLVQRKIHGMDDANFSSGDDVEPQALFLKYKSQSCLVQEGFGGINDQCIRIMFTELFFEFTALMAKGDFIEKIERRAEFLSHVNNIAAADNDVTLLIYLRSEGKKS